MAQSCQSYLYVGSSFLLTVYMVPPVVGWKKLLCLLGLNKVGRTVCMMMVSLVGLSRQNMGKL